MGMSSISMERSVPNLTTFTIILLFSLSCSVLTPTEAYGELHPNGNITIKWDVINWTPDGYVALVAINNFQKHDSIKAPGWKLEWTWARKEVIWSTVGGQATEQGNCKEFKGNIPVSRKKTPAIIDLKPQVPYNWQIANCCKGGVLSSWFQDRVNSTSEFQLSVGRAGNTRRTVKLPKRFVFKAPGAKFTCGRANKVTPTLFITADKRRVTQVLMTWRVTCFAGRIKVI